MNRDLFLSILAIDSYNRGYGQGIGGLAATGPIGNATIINDSFALGGTTNNRLDSRAGFYAIAYDVSNVSGFVAGERVISYRGTDDILAFPNSRDFWNGWTLGAGFSGPGPSCTN